MTKEYLVLKETYLRGIKKEDYTEGLYSWANNPEVTHYMFTGLRPSIKDKMEQLYFDIINNDKEIVFAIVDKKTDKVIGLTGLYQLNYHIRSAEFRIIIGEPEFWGKGIGTECAKALVNYAFNNLNLNKVWLGGNEDNKGAIKCYQKAGFVQEGVLRQEVYRNNKYYNNVIMSVIKEEWEKKKNE